MAEPKSKNITWHGAHLSPEERSKHLESRGCVAWFTGLSASGKSTVCRRVEQLLVERGINAYVLDGDNIRHGLNKDLGFSAHDRAENIRRIAEVAKLFADASVITLTAFISPYRKDRDQAREIMPEGEFIEVFVDTPLAVCEERDPKGLYKKARAGEIPNFTGISDPYEAPTAPEIHMNTADRTVDDCAQQVIAYLVDKGFIAAK